MKNLNEPLGETITKLSTENESFKEKKINGLTDELKEINPTQFKETISALQAEK